MEDKKELAKKSNREKFPEISKIIDDFREVFSNACVIGFEINGKKYGSIRTHRFLEFHPNIHPVMIGVLNATKNRR